MEAAYLAFLAAFDGKSKTLSIAFIPTRVMIGLKVRKRAKIRNRYNQAPHLTQDTYGKVKSQLDIRNESPEVSSFPAGDHRHQQTDVHESITKEDRNDIYDPQKRNNALERSVKYITGWLKLF